MGDPVIHDCLETTEATYSSRPDLKNTPLMDAENWFTDRLSSVEKDILGRIMAKKLQGTVVQGFEKNAKSQVCRKVKMFGDVNMHSYRMGSMRLTIHLWNSAGPGCHDKCLTTCPEFRLKIEVFETNITKFLQKNRMYESTPHLTRKSYNSKREGQVGRRRTMSASSKISQVQLAKLGKKRNDEAEDRRERMTLRTDRDMTLSAMIELTLVVFGNTLDLIISEVFSNLIDSVARSKCAELLSSPVCMSSSEDKITVHFINRDGDKLTAKGKPGDSLLDVVVDNNLDIDGFGACEGTLACSTCHLIFEDHIFEKLDAITDEEMDMLDLAYGLTETSRLGCQICLKKSMNDMTVRVPEAVADARQSVDMSKNS
ncbi:hypothetical protein TURU_168067 [Turdus rufiventris]|nr:hypothetical protein TURU_168067 [Turdus rufiventris]